jgi:hypothetical protein
VKVKFEQAFVFVIPNRRPFAGEKSALVGQKQIPRAINPRFGMTNC